MTKHSLRLGSRGSKLALWQAHHVQQLLQSIHPSLEIEIVVVQTTADAQAEKPLTGFGTQGVFVKELETALAEERIDIAVHSLKDVPTELPAGMAIGAILERADPHDAILSPTGKGLGSIPEGTVVGTSSPRRIAQLLHTRPDLSTREIRGNLDTRIRKMESGEYGCLVLAMAGLQRLAPAGVKPVAIDYEVMLPAPGQGAIAIELRAADAAARETVAPLDHPVTAACVAAERAMLARLGGGCQLPVGCIATIGSKGKLSLRGVVADRKGRKLLRAEATGSDPKDVGDRVAEKLNFMGADYLLR